MIKRLTAAVVCLAILLAHVAPASASNSGIRKHGKASWYGEEQHGLPTASGEDFDMKAFTAAHKKLPLGSVVKVTNVRNGRSVLVTVNDRGPYSGNRIIDLSYVAASRLGMVRQGVAPVKLDVMANADGSPLQPGKAFYIDIRRFAYKSDALRLVRSLEKSGLASARAVHIDGGKNKAWMVAVGPFRNFHDAAGVRSTLQRKQPQSEIILERSDL